MTFVGGPAAVYVRGAPAYRDGDVLAEPGVAASSCERALPSGGAGPGGALMTGAVDVDARGRRRPARAGRAHRRTRTARSAWPGPTRWSAGAATGCATRWPRSPASRSRPTRPATSGRRCRASRERFVIVGGHLDSVPDGGWLDGALNVVAGARGAARAGRRARAAAHAQAGRLGRRGGRALRPQPDGLERRAPAPSIPTPCAACSTATASRCRTPSPAHGVELDRMREARRASSTASPPTSSCTSSRGRCSSASTCRSASCSGTFGVQRHVVRFPARTRTPARRRWTLRRDAFLAAARSALAFRDEAARREDVRATTGAVARRAGHRHGLQRDLRAVARPARARRRRAGRDGRRGARGSRRDRRRGGLRGRVGAASRRSSRSPSTPSWSRSPTGWCADLAGDVATGCRAARCTTPPRWPAWCPP